MVHGASCALYVAFGMLYVACCMSSVAFGAYACARLGLGFEVGKQLLELHSGRRRLGP
jgi:hypothetical protein